MWKNTTNWSNKKTSTILLWFFFTIITLLYVINNFGLFSWNPNPWDVSSEQASILLMNRAYRDFIPDYKLNYWYYPWLYSKDNPSLTAPSASCSLGLWANELFYCLISEWYFKYKLDDEEHVQILDSALALDYKLIWGQLNLCFKKPEKDYLKISNWLNWVNKNVENKWEYNDACLSIED